MTLHQLSTTEFSTIAPHSVLVAVDCSRTSLRAADYATGLANRSGVAVVGVYVRHHGVLLASSPGLSVYAQAAETQLRRRGWRATSPRAPVRHGLPPAPSPCWTAHPSSPFAPLAKELRVSGSRGRGVGAPGAHRYFGSLAVRLARTAPCPVIIVP